MAVIHSAGFHTWDRQFKSVDLLLYPDRPRPPIFATTFITGRNGSHKSTLLKEIVSGLTAVGRSAREEASSIQHRANDVKDAIIKVIRRRRNAVKVSAGL